MGKKSDKKVLFLASWYPSKEHKTLGNFVQKHAELANEVANVDVLYAVDSETVSEITIEEELVNKVRTIIVYYPPIKSNVPFISAVLKKETYLLALRKGFKYLDTPYDWVHLNAVFPAGLFARWIKRNYKIPYYVTVHWTGFLPHHQLYEKLPFYVKKAFQSIFRDAKKVLPVSQHLGESLKDLKLINDYEVLPNVINSNYFYPSPDLKQENEPIRFLHISTFDNEHKNTEAMLDVFGKLKTDFRLHLVTEGEVEEVMEAIERYNIPKEKCIINQRLSTQEIGEAMRQADCFVLFSNYETFSVVLAEAWMSGTPAIYSQCGGLTEINNKNVGVQIQPKDNLALLKALESFTREDFNTQEIQAFASQFSISHLKEKLMSLY